jgi:hypothetical protein
MKYANIKFRILSIFSFLFLSAPLVTKAQGDLTTQNYQPLESIPGLTDNISSTTPVNLTDFLTNGFNFLVAVAVVIAVVFITVGGFQYLTSTAVGSKDAAKTRIQDSVKGIILILLTYIILYTINPNTVSLDFLTGIDDSNRITLRNSSGATNFFFKYINRRDLGRPNPKVISSATFNTIGDCEDEMEFIKLATNVQYEVVPEETCASGEFAPGESQYVYDYFYYDEPGLDVLTNSNSPRTTDSKFVPRSFLEKSICEKARTDFKKSTEETLRNTVKTSCFIHDADTPDLITDLIDDAYGNNTYAGVTDFDDDDDIDFDDERFFYAGYYSFIFEYSNASSPTETLYRSKPFGTFRECLLFKRTVPDMTNTSYVIPNECRPETSGVAINFYESQVKSTLTDEIIKVMHISEAECVNHEAQQLALPKRSTYQIIGSECLKN